MATRTPRASRRVRAAAPESGRVPSPAGPRGQRSPRLTTSSHTDTPPRTLRAAVERWLVPASLALLCLAAYANSFDAGFALDNRQLILNDPRVHAFTRENLSLIARHSYWWPYGESGLYRPLTTLTYLADYAVLGHGTNPAGYHAFNLLVHITNVLLLWRIVVRLTSSAWTAAAAAAL